MERRKFLTAIGSTSAAAVAGCTSIFDSVEQIDSLPRPTRGDEDAPITLEVFNDLGCESCRDFEEVVYQSVVSDYVEDEDVYYMHYDFVLPADPTWSELLNATARGVQERLDTEAFFDYKREVYGIQDNLSSSAIRDALSEVGVDEVEEVFNQADGGRYTNVLQDDRDFGESEYDVGSTPTVVMNNTVLDSVTVLDADSMQTAIDTELANLEGD